MNDILKDVSMAHRIVVKVGTSTLTYEHGTMNLKTYRQTVYGAF